MDQVIPLITTPLALAALCLLLGSGLLKVVLKQKSSTQSKMIVRYGFIFAISLSILANVAFVYTSRLASEVVITGSVRNEEGHYLPRVVLDIAGKSRGITDDNGAFAMVIPYSRSDSSYRIDASGQGYSLTSVGCDAANRNKVTIIMKRPQLSADVLLAFSGDVLVSHFLGSPQVDIPVTFRNPTSETVQISAITVKLQGILGAGKTLSMVNSYIQGGPLQPPLTIVTLKAGDSFSNISAFADIDQETIQQSAMLRQRLTMNQSYIQYGARIGVDVIDTDLEHQIKSAVNKRWFWKPGQYSLTISFVANGAKYEIMKHFTLDTNQVDEMKAILSYYKEGFGLIYGVHLVQIANARPSLYLSPN